MEKNIKKKRNTHTHTHICVSVLSCVPLFGTPWSVIRQSPLSMEFSRQECWSGSPFPSPRDLPDPGIEPMSPALAGKFFGQPNIFIVLKALHVIFIGSIVISKLCILPLQSKRFSSVQFSCSVMSDSWQPHRLQHARSPCSSPALEFTQTHIH